MKKLNKVVYQKLLLQAEEAKEQGLTKLAGAVLSAVGPVPEDEAVKYSYGELETELYEGLWKMATYVFKYHDVESLDIEKVGEVIEILAEKLIDDVESAVGEGEIGVIGKLEQKVAGEE